MTSAASDNRTENWSSRLGFLLASIGFSVGLGNIWRFPYLVGEHGGSAFILIYLVFAFGIGVPIVIAEWTIGRLNPGTASPTASFRAIATRHGASSSWGAVGGLAVLAVFMLMLFYTVVTGWTLDYVVLGASGAFDGIDADGTKSLFAELLGNPVRLAFWHTVVVIVTVYVNSRGINSGIEKSVTILMPALFVSLLVMVVYAAFVGDVAAAARFLLTPDFSRLTAASMLAALGQAFFSIGIAMAVMITYGSYLGSKESIPQNAFIVVSADTLVAVLAGFAIFPLVLAHGLAPDAGTGLVFHTLPIAFGDLPGGRIFSGIFFLLLVAAALTSCIGNFAPVVAWTEGRLRISHSRAALLSGFALWLLGLGTVFSFNSWSNFHPLSFVPGFENRTIYDNLDFIVSNMMLPIGAFLTAIFIGWLVSSESVRQEMRIADGFAFRLWWILVRFVVPVAVGVLSITGISA